MHFYFAEAIRAFRRSPLTVIASTAVLSLGMGASIQTSALFDRLFLNPLPHVNKNTFLATFTKPSDLGRTEAFVASSEYRSVRSVVGPTEISASGACDLPISVRGSNAYHQAAVLLVSSGYFKALNVHVISGRPLDAQDDDPAAPPTALVAWRFASRHFNSGPDAVGHAILVGGMWADIVGVVSPEFEGTRIDTDVPEVLVPLSMVDMIPALGQFATNTNGGPRWINLFASLPDDQVRARLRGRLADSLTIPPGTIHFERLQDTVLSPASRAETRDFVMVLAMAVGAIWLLCCTSVGLVILSRVERRREEILLRNWLGASQWQMVAPYLIESIAIALVAMSGGVAAGFGLRKIVGALQLPGRVPLSVVDSVPGSRLALLAACCTMLTVVATNVAPVAAVSRLLRSGRFAGSTNTALSVHGPRILLAVQAGLSVVLISGSLLFLRTLMVASSIPLGFAPANLLVAMFDRAAGRTGSQDDGRLIEAIVKIPGVIDAAIGPPPLVAADTAVFSLAVDGLQRRLAARASVNVVTINYFRVLHQQVLAGRSFSAPDTEVSQPVGIVSHSLAKELWPAADAVGHRLRMSPTSQELVIVGVVKDVAGRDLHETASRTLYVPRTQSRYFFGDSTWTSNLIVRTSTRPDAMAAAVIAVVAKLEPDAPLYNIQSMEQRLWRILMPQRLGTVVLSGLSVLAVVMTALAIYAHSLSSVMRNARNIAIRRAIGARDTDVLTYVFASSLSPVGVGSAIGLLQMPLWIRAARRFLYVPSTGLDAAFQSCVVILSVGLLATTYAAIRACQIDPGAGLKACDGCLDQRSTELK